MSILNKLKVNDSSIQEDKDSVGGGFLVNSGAYNCEVEMAYLGESQGGAMSLTVHLKTDTGALVRNTLWVTSGKAKGQLPYYEKNGKKSFLPGYNQANALCLLTVGKEIGDMEPEEKVINLYNYDAGKELPTKSQVLVDLIGTSITAGIIKQTVDKNVKDASGNYVPSGETREENEIDKLFRSKDGLTVAEIKAEATESVFLDQWKTKWTDVVKNKAKGASGSTAGAPAASAAKPAKSLFS